MKKLLCVIPLAILFCFTFACQNKAEKAELEKYRTQAKLEEQNKAIVSREWDAYSKGDYEAFKQVVAPVYVWYDPSGSVKPRALEETIEYGKMLHKSFRGRSARPGSEHERWRGLGRQRRAMDHAGVVDAENRLVGNGGGRSPAFGSSSFHA